MEPTADARRLRLLRLQGWLAEDPRNTGLLAEACDAAIEAGEAGALEACLQQAGALGLQDAPWSFRRARLALLRGDWEAACALLEALQAATGPHPALAHDLGFARLQRGDASGCRDAVQPWCPPAPAGEDDDPRTACAALWLQALHRLGALDQAWDWLQCGPQPGAMPPRIAGVASLLAVDRGDFTQARQLSALALGAHPQLPQALVASASVALAGRDTATAVRHLHTVLAAHPAEGRAWSALGLALLQDGHATQAAGHFEAAVKFMPAHIGSWHGLGWSRLLEGQAGAALAAFRAALEIDPAFAESHGGVALALLLAGKAEDASPHLERADRLDRQNVTGRYARALAAGELREPGALRQLARRLLDRPGLFGGRLRDALPPDGP